MRLNDYLRKHGAKECAERFGVSEHTIHSWMCGRRKPRSDKALEIVAATEGTVTLPEIFEREVA